MRLPGERAEAKPIRDRARTEQILDELMTDPGDPLTVTDDTVSPSVEVQGFFQEITRKHLVMYRRGDRKKLRLPHSAIKEIINHTYSYDLRGKTHGEQTSD